jgi:hypothetical protein
MVNVPQQVIDIQYPYAIIALVVDKATKICSTTLILDTGTTAGGMPTEVVRL